MLTAISFLVLTASKLLCLWCWCPCIHPYFLFFVCSQLHVSLYFSLSIICISWGTFDM
ncbi:hypothetical protein HD554DRAFT_2140072 [Boletus coccyginus]|nr:hypothetical protein HD554DRAFT_2140072 [Boletus coccyginus]